MKKFFDWLNNWFDNANIRLKIVSEELKQMVKVDEVTFSTCFNIRHKSTLEGAEAPLVRIESRQHNVSAYHEISKGGKKSAGPST